MQAFPGAMLPSTSVKATLIHQHALFTVFLSLLAKNSNWCRRKFKTFYKYGHTLSVINQLHKRALRVLQNDYTGTFEDLLEKSEEVTVHCSNLQKLMIEIYECTNYIGPAVLTEFFTTKEISYDLRIKNLIQIPKVKLFSYGQSSLSFRGSILWNTLSDSIKSVQNIKGFKTMIRDWEKVLQVLFVNKNIT